jgi:hypothetical protein
LGDRFHILTFTYYTVKIFFNQELEVERENHKRKRKRKLQRGVNGIVTRRDDEIKLLKEKLKKRGESFSKMKAERDDQKAVVAARDGTIADLEAKVKRLENTIRLKMWKSGTWNAAETKRMRNCKTLNTPEIRHAFLDRLR